MSSRGATPSMHWSPGCTPTTERRYHAAAARSAWFPPSPQADAGTHATEGVAMRLIANLLTAFVALSHLGILILEMFFWDHPVGRRIFEMTPEVSASSAVLAANQGLYNAFLAAGMVWGLWSGRRDLKLFFLGCVILAGLYGGLTAKTSILLTQGLPAALAFVAVLLAFPRQGHGAG